MNEPLSTDHTNRFQQSRRHFIGLAAATFATSVLSASPLRLFLRPKDKIKAILFDGFAIFNPKPVYKIIEDLYPDKAKQITEAWQSHQFNYQWLRSLAGKYKNFTTVTRNALDFALKQNGLNVGDKEKDLIMAGFESLTAWPDVAPALQSIKSDGLKMGFLSNMTANMLNKGIQHAGLTPFFDLVISTDEKQTYKPAHNAYQMGTDRLKLRKEEILFVPFAGWDNAGAKWFGYPSFWVNRLKAPLEELDAEPDGTGNNLDELVAFIRKYNSTR